MPVITKESEVNMSMKESASCQVYSVENHPNDSRVKIRSDNKVQTLSSRMGTGGGNVPMVMYAIENDITPKIDGNGKAFSLRAREYKDVQIVVMEKNNGGV